MSRQSAGELGEKDENVQEMRRLQIPAAISLDTTLAARKRDEDVLSVYFIFEGNMMDLTNGDK